MRPREVLARATTPDGEPLELAVEAGHHVLRIRGNALMSSATSGSEEAMARVASEALGPGRARRVLIGGLGMGFTCRAALEAFSGDASITVAELLPTIVDLHREHLGHLANHPLDDPRVTVRVCDVRDALAEGGWDVVLMDVDNGPDAFTVRSNASLYGRQGAALLAAALAPGGVVVVWSASPSPRFEQILAGTGLEVTSHLVYARGDARRGPRHTLFVGIAQH